MPFFQPTDITGIFCWWRAHDINLGANSGVVCYWQDVSGSGNNLLVDTHLSTSSNMCPFWIPNQLNGYPTVRFNGTSNFLAVTGLGNPALGTFYFGSMAPSSLTSFIVYKTRSTTKSQSLFSNDNIIGNNPPKQNFALTLNTNSPSGWSFMWGSDLGILPEVYVGSTAFTAPADTWFLRSDRWRASDRQFIWSRDGTDMQSGVAISQSANTVNELKVGARASGSFITDFFNGEIAEIVGYDRKLDDSEVFNINQYLQQKYLIGGVGGIPLFMFSTDNPGLYNNITLVIPTGTQVASNNTTLFEGGFNSGNLSTTLYIGGLSSISSGISLYVSGVTAQNNFISMYSAGYTSGNAFFPLYISSSLTGTKTLTLYTAALTSGMASMPLITYSVPPSQSSGGFPLSMVSITSSHSISGLFRGMSLYVDSYGNSANMPLFISTEAETTSGTPFSSLPLFISGPITSGVRTNLVPLFVGNYFTEVSAPRLKMFVKGDGLTDGALVGNSNMNLFLNRPTANAFSLYIASNTVTSGIPLYIKGAHIVNSGVSLIAVGMGVSSGNSLYIAGPGLISQGINMSISGKPLVSNNISLYSHGF